MSIPRFNPNVQDTRTRQALQRAAAALETLNSGAVIDAAALATHIANVSNPHAVTATQVGAGTAQWNADKLRTMPIQDIGTPWIPSNYALLQWNKTATNTWEMVGVQNVMGMTAKGDIPVSDGPLNPNIAQVLAVAGSNNGDVVTRDSTTALGVKWAAPAGGSSLPVSDATEIVKGSVTDTKKMRFEVDGFAGAATRVLTVQDKDGTIACVDDIATHAALTATHGATGAVVGTTNVQNLSGKTFTDTITSTLAIGTKPLTVTSTTMCDNLNADMVDGNHAAAFATSGHGHSHTALTDIGTNTHAQIDTHLGAANPHSGSQPVDATLTELAAQTITQGCLLYGVAADDLSVLAKGTAGQVLAMNAGATAPGWTSDYNIYKFGFTLESPTASEDQTIGNADRALTITRIVAVVTGTTPSVTWTIRKGSDRDAAGTEVVTAGTTTTLKTTGSVVTAFNSAGITVNDFLWLETTAMSGTVLSLNVTIFCTINPSA